MKNRLAAIGLALLCVQVSPLAQNVAPIAVIKLGKLQAGDTLRIGLYREPDREGGMMNLSLTVGVFDDGTIRMPFLDRTPAAGLNISELTRVLEERYDTYFILPPLAHATPPPRIVVQYLGKFGKTAMDNLIERIGRVPGTR